MKKVASWIILGGGVGGWTQGALLVYGNNSASSPLNVEAGLTDGANQSNTDFTGRPSPLSTDPTVTGAPAAHAVDFGLAGRAEWKLMGDWKNYRDFTAMGTTQDLLVLGGGTDWSQGGDGNLILGTLDAQYENAHGLGLYGAALLRHMDKELNTAGKEATDWGLLAQVSYMCTPAFEIFGRYDVTFFDNEIVFASGDSEDTFHELTIGCNYYLGQNGAAGHRAKITIDLGYLPNGSPAAYKGLGIQDDTSGHDEWMLRGQFQLLI